MAWRLEGSGAGNVGIGTTAPAETFHVSGTTRLVSNVAIGMNATPSATLQVSGTFKIGGMASESCTNAKAGLMRLNPATGEMEVCAQ